jgi:hypothetical protein
MNKEVLEEEVGELYNLGLKEDEVEFILMQRMKNNRN